MVGADVETQIAVLEEPPEGLELGFERFAQQTTDAVLDRCSMLGHGGHGHESGPE
jgi:hypothetical protein